MRSTTAVVINYYAVVFLVRRGPLVIPGRSYRLPPPPPILARRHVSERVGGAYVEAPHGRIFICPPFAQTPPTPRRVFSGVGGVGLVAPYRAILRYYRCDTAYRAILSKGSQQSPKMVRYPPLVLGFAQAHLCDTCDTPFCNVSRDNCAIPHKNKHKRVLRYYRYMYHAI